MKRIFNFACVALAIVTATSCDPENEIVDFPITDNFSISASYLAFIHGGGYGWQNGEQIGVFVTSDGVTQANLLYTPSDTSKVEIVTGTNPYTGEDYEEEVRSVVEDVVLNAADEVAGFKKGEHNIYAYTPYNESVSDYSAVVLPNLAAQTYSEKMWMKYGFGYAKTSKSISEFSSATISLGDFKPVVYPISVSGITLTEEQLPTFQGRKVTQVKVISSDLAIASVESTIDLSTGEIKGSTDKTIVLTYPGEGIDIEFLPGIPYVGIPDEYAIPSATVYALVNPETDITTRQEEYTSKEDQDGDGVYETEVTKYKDVSCLKGSFTVVYTIGGVEYTATTISNVMTLASTGEIMSLPLTPTLQ